MRWRKLGVGKCLHTKYDPSCFFTIIDVSETSTTEKTKIQTKTRVTTQSVTIKQTTTITQITAIKPIATIKEPTMMTAKPTTTATPTTTIEPTNIIGKKIFSFSSCGKIWKFKCTREHVNLKQKQCHLWEILYQCDFLIFIFFCVER